ncbi:thioesterase [Rufibacter radiotolerans]|uniref:Thioesterase n=1 Tax=Rufibacter radiotolerans TaxID=1379910 RepID=A0A0H4VK13_9BACT|nr:PaaI family thioesterase [Rufibacter radiotolerans]AKQ45693.1 thioesterase [Rufibacter radiotolerans]
MLKTYNDNFKDTVKEKLQRQFYMHLLGFDLETVEIGQVSGQLVLEEKHKQHKGFAHGGVIATLADIVMGFAVVTLVPANQHVVTADLKISYLRPGVGEAILAKGWVLKQGRKLNFCEAEIFSIDGLGHKKLIAKASATMAVLAPDATHS